MRYKRVKYKNLSAKQAAKIIETRKPVGVFFVQGKGAYIGIDNRTGDAWTEEFRNKQDLFKWLSGEPEEICMEDEPVISENLMEYERKFLITEFPLLPLIFKADVEQGYLSIHPEVRIRSIINCDVEEYIEEIKSDGTIARKEIPIPLAKGVFQEIKQLIGKPLITKDYRAFDLGNGLKIQCSIVDKGAPTEFMYAEVEFQTEEKANSFIPPDFLGKEVTLDPFWKMKNYWERTRLSAGGKL